MATLKSSLLERPRSQPPLSDVKWASVSSHWIFETDHRFDATPYATGAEALAAIDSCSLLKAPLGSLCGTIWHPVQDQARSNFKRIYTDSENGHPFVTSREMFSFPLRPDRFLSRKMPKLGDLIIDQGWLVMSDSGSVGRVLFINKRLHACAVTNNAIRIEPKKVPAGYLYGFLASRFGQALVLKNAYGSTVSHLEAQHLENLPVPIADDETQRSIHRKITQAYRQRDEANDLLEKADTLLHSILGVPRFKEADVEYLGRPEQPKAFAIRSSDLGSRFDATHHVPVATSAIAKLSRGKYPLVRMAELTGDIYLAPRFARIYVAKEHGTPFLQGSHVAMMRIHDLKYISNTQTERMDRWIIRKGQVLVTCSGTLGRIGLATKLQDGWAASQHILRLTARAGVSHPGFLAAFLMTPYGQHQLLSKSYGGVVDELTDRDTAEIFIPKVAPDKQSEIGVLVEEAYELRDKANAAEDAAIAEFEALL